MARLFWLEIEALLRRPMWVLLVAFSVWIFFSGMLEGSFALRTYIGLELPFLGLPRSLFSIGEWGRSILLMLETFGGLFLSLTVSLIAIGSFFPEWQHREVLWATHKGTRLRFALTKVVAVSSFTVCLFVLGACAAFLNPSVREAMNPGGWQYVPLYVALVWIRVSLWVALAMLLFSLTRSRWAAVFLVFALHMAWFGTAGIWWEPSLPRLLHRNLIAWNFVGVFAPFGIVPRAFFLQGMMFTGIALALAAAALLVRRRFPAWAGLKLFAAKAAVAGAVVLTLGTGWWITRAIQAQTAPFTAAALWDGRATLDRPYIWSRDYRLLVYPGKDTMAVLLPPGAPIPGWVEQLAVAGGLRRHDDVKRIILDGHLGDEERAASASLVLVHRSPDAFPRELQTAAARYWQAVSLLLDRARPWLGTVPQLTIIWPEDALPHGPIIKGEELRISCASLHASIRAKQVGVARALSHALSSERLVQTYLVMHLMTGMFREEVEEVLAWFRSRARGESPAPKVALGIWLHPAFGKAEQAAEVLQHWQRGEEMGHEKYIGELLGEGRGD